MKTSIVQSIRSAFYCIIMKTLLYFHDCFSSNLSKLSFPHFVQITCPAPKTDFIIFCKSLLYSDVANLPFSPFFVKWLLLNGANFSEGFEQIKQ